MVWKCIYGVAPAYLGDLCIPAAVTSGREKWRSASSLIWLIPRVQPETGQRSFAVNGPTSWNSLPLALRASEPSQNAFIRALKTHLFSSARHRWNVLAQFWRRKQTHWLIYLHYAYYSASDILSLSPLRQWEATVTQSFKE